MVCKTTWRADRRGLSFVEVLVMGFLSILCVGLISGFLVFSGKGLLAISNYVAMDTQSRMALDRMVMELRQVGALAAGTPSSFSFYDTDKDMIEYAYHPSIHQFRRLQHRLDGKGNKKTTVAEALLTECDGVKIEYFERDPQSGTFDLSASTNIAFCKGLQVSWQCSRRILGAKLNTEEMTSTLIVMRMK